MKRVAIFLPGAIGHTAGMHVPAIVGLVKRLSVHFDITVYSFVKPDLDDQPFTCGNARVKFIKAQFDDSAPRKIFQYMKAFWDDHQKDSFDLLHGFWALPCGWVAVALGKLLHLPSLVSVQGSEAANLPSIGYGDMRSQPTRSLTLWTCRRTSALAFLTEFQRQALREFRLERNDALIIPYGAEENFFLKTTRDETTPPLNIIHVGFSNSVKDQLTLLKTFQLINKKMSSRLRIIGGGPLDDELKDAAKALDISGNVEFLGYVPHNELPEHYRWAHLMLHTSLYEGQCVAIAEAAASNVLICGTKVGLISDLGLKATVSVNIGDYHSLAEKVLGLLNAQEEMKQLRAQAYQWAAAHSATWTADQYRILYDQLMND